MLAIDLINEAAALAGYTIDTSTDGIRNKARALRRLNIIKTDIISRYSGIWPANYREGWLALYPLAPCLATFTSGSFTVPTVSDGSTLGNTIFTSGVPSYMAGAKILAPDGSYYRISSVDTSNVYLDTPYQGATAVQGSTTIWNDEYTLYPDALNVAGFVNYVLQATMMEAYPGKFKESFPKQVAVGNPDVYEVIGKQPLTSSYVTGSVSGTVNTNTLTGSNTAWKANLQPGYEITIGTVKYHVRTVDSDTQVSLYQLLTQTYSGQSYSAIGKNAVKIRFRYPTSQSVVSYWYWQKDRPFVNDSDEDWVAEQYPRVIQNGMAYFDYIDKNDIARAFNSTQVFEDSIKNMRVAQDTAYTGVRTIGLYIPDEARE